MAHTALWEDTTAVESGLTVQVLTQPAINLALVHNGVPLISGLRVTNNSGSSVVDMTVTVRLHGDGAELTPAWQRTYDGDLSDGADVFWDDFGAFAPQTSYLRELNESHPATLSVTVTRMWGPDVHLTTPIRVLAHNEWFNAPIFYDSLAAFVQPNTKSVRSVLNDAAELLRTNTGDSSISGYQAGPERAALIAAAIYEVLRARRIRYINPPASFEATGQKIRTTAGVLDERFGTCIDLSVAYAACLEASGLRPLVWLVTGHAFAGFLREEANLSHPSLTEQNALVNLVESGIAVPVEAVFYEESSNGSFSSAIATARQHFSTPESLAGVVDIAAARRSGVRPLPSLDDVAAVASPEPTKIGGIVLELPGELRAQNQNDEVLDTTDSAPARVRKWKRSLLDLSTRNRLLNLKASSQVIDLHVPHNGLPILDDIVHAGTPLTLAPHDDLSSIHQLQGARRAAEIDPDVLRAYLSEDHQLYAAVPNNAYTRRFKELARTARTLFEETGSSNLYLTLGALVHHTSTGAEARAPLFLLPVKISGGTGRKQFHITTNTTEVASPNYCLVEWLRLKHNVSIEALEAPKLDDSGIDIVHALRGIRSALVENNIDLRVDEVATLAICQFGTFGMWKDLSDSWEILEQSPIVRHLTHHPGESFHDPNADGDAGLEQLEVDESAVPVPIPADGSQLRAIALAAAGRTFVLEGPPGTGKSQTITNLIAHALELGKTVLFVAEKQAALDVVKRRLERVGLQNFTLDLHGKSQSPNVIRDQLKAAIDNSIRYNERTWDARLAEFRARLAPLADYPRKLHQRNGIDYSLWSAFEEILETGDGPVAPIPIAYVARPSENWSAVKAALDLFSRAARPLDIAPGVPWSLAGAIPSSVGAEQIASAVRRFANAFDAAETSDRVRSLLAANDDPSQLVALLEPAKHQLGRPVPDAPTLAWMGGAQFSGSLKALRAEIEQLQRNCAPLLATFTPMFVETGDIAATVTEAEECDKRMFGRKKKAEQFQRSMAPFAQPGTDLAPQRVLPLLRAIPGVREHVSRTQTLARELLGPFMPARWNPLAPGSAEELRPIFDYIAATLRFIDTSPGEWRLLETTGFPADREIGLLEEVSDAWTQLRHCLGTTDDDVTRWRNGEHWLTAWKRTSGELIEDAELFNARHLLDWSRMSSYLAPLRQAGLDEFVEALLTARIPAADATAAFIRGTAATSLDERRRSTGLNNFLSDLRDGEIDDFVHAAESLREEQVKALAATLLERRPFRAGSLTGEVGELRRSLDRRRGGLSFRQLMNKYADHILAATPCVFVSPASLAQFIPPGSATFDIVVFDEASQVTVAQAIGALGRGRSAVIVGDSQQMPPTSFGQVTASDDDDAPEEGELAPEDLDSILTECVESGVPRLWLSWHYRSQDETLISFSNQKYYGGRLASLPSPGGDSTAGVEWRRVAGHFNREDRGREHRTNRVEAEAVVEEIRTRLATPHLAHQSIGVVTFNAQQRTLVEDLLDECDDPLVRENLRPDAEEGIFVKNLENVQGDERDVILFTAAFSTKPGETQLPLNFGPLSRSGGEKRFNVAITRARRKVIVFTSFDPSHIDLSRTKSVGMAHLRGYLEMASYGPSAGEHPRDGLGLDPIQRDICAGLRERGYEVDANYGLSDFVLDLVVREPGCEHWQVAIMLDGPRWAERPTAADRDLTPRLLETMMHWGSSLRVWLPDWIDNRGAVLDRVDAAIETSRSKREAFEAELAAAAEERAALIAKLEAEATVERADEPAPLDLEDVETEDSSTAEPTDDSAQRDEPELVASAPIASSLGSAAIVLDKPAARDWDGRGTTYLCAPTTTLGERTDLDRTNSASVRRIITDAVRETVETEGPIALDRLARVVANRFGFDRVSAARKAFVIDCVPTELVHSGPLGTFVWPHQIDRATWLGYRTTPDDMTRSLNEIAPEEIVNAMRAAGASAALETEPLMRATMAIFKQRRLAGASRERLEACIAAGLADGRLIRIGSHIRPGA
ncbi:DNA/RNA helicase [Nocardia nova]|nr:DNA/RNA helicase [Nocardia nova]